jgi:hypothetical protein
MAGIFGALGLNDTEYVWQATQGQGLIFDAANAYLDRVNMEIERAYQIFVSAETENHKERFKLPGGGRLQKLGQDPQSEAGAVKANGSWDTAYPLEEYGATISNTRVSMAYMTVGDLNNHIQTVVNQNVNTVRYEMLLKLFKNTNTTFVDTKWGSLTVVPLANADSVVYPPVIGSESEATDDHYLESGYAASAISDTNNPYVTIEAELVEHFGKSQGNDNVAVFINKAQKAKTEDLTDFVELEDRFVMVGDQTATLSGLPAGHPGRVIGRTNGCWVVEWDWIPANYMVGIHLDTQAPLKKRIDPAAVGLGRGLQLVSQDTDHPFETSHWSHRFGFGVANRLSAVVMELGTGGTYTIPTAYQ